MTAIREALENAATQLGVSDDDGGGDAASAMDAAPVDARPVVETTEDAPAQVADEERKSEPSRTRDEVGRFAKGKGDEKKPDQAPAAQKAQQKPVVPTPVRPTQAGAIAPPQPVAAAEPIKAPQSWKPAAREHFARLPPEVQAEVMRREKETAIALQESAPARKEVEAWRQAVAPFEAQIRAEGGEPIQAVHSLLQTAAALRGPNKVAVVANLIRSFGVPLQELDAALAGEAPPPQGQQPAQFRDPRFDEFLGTLQQAQTQKRQAQQQRAAADVQAFAKENEFFDDVRYEMQAFMTSAAERKVAMTLQEAYNRACWGNDEVRAILQQREAAKAANVQVASTQQARAAASSLKSQPTGGVGGGSKPNSRRAAIEAAAEALSKR